jgi:hypothetical protein
MARPLGEESNEFKKKGDRQRSNGVPEYWSIGRGTPPPFGCTNTPLLQHASTPPLRLLELLVLLVLLLNRIQPANLHPKLEPKEQRKSGADLLPILLAFHHSKHGGARSRH